MNRDRERERVCVEEGTWLENPRPPLSPLGSQRWMQGAEQRVVIPHIVGLGVRLALGSFRKVWVAMDESEIRHNDKRGVGEFTLLSHLARVKEVTKENGRLVLGQAF